MLIIHYTEGFSGKAVSDFEIEAQYKSILLEKNAPFAIHFWYSTSNIFLRIRLGIVSGDINCENIKFMTDDGVEIKINKYGAILDWPKGFCDKESEIACNILHRAMTMRKAELRK